MGPMGLAFLHLLSSLACVTFGSHSPAGTDAARGLLLPSG